MSTRLFLPQIDFGGDIDYGNAIDFGELGADDITLESGDIDWGDGGGVAEIDFSISLEDSGIKVEESGLAGGVAKCDQALSVLDSPTYRDQFLDELFELEAFLKIRVLDLNSLAQSNSFLITDGIDSHTSESISSLLSVVQVVIEKATSEHIQHLHHLKHSEKYADILAGKLQQKLTGIEKLRATRQLLKMKIEVFREDKVKLQPLVGKLTEQTKVLQREVSDPLELIVKVTDRISFFQIESDISKRYKNRPVNLMGGLNLF